MEVTRRSVLKTLAAMVIAPLGLSKTEPDVVDHLYTEHTYKEWWNNIDQDALAKAIEGHIRCVCTNEPWVFTVEEIEEPNEYHG